MPNFTDTLKDVAQVSGAALLGASGPSGRASATSLLNNRLRLAEAQRQSDIEIEQLAEEKETEKHKRGLELWTKAVSDPDSNAKLKGDVNDQGISGLDLARRQIATHATALGVPNAELYSQSLEPEAEEVSTRSVTHIDPVSGKTVVQNVPTSDLTARAAAPSRVEQGGPGAFDGITKSGKSKAILEIAEARTSQEDFTAGINQVVDFYRSENFVGGITGKVLQGFNSALRQASQVLGEKDPLIIAGKLNIDTLDENLSAENVSFMRKAAISGNVRDSALMRLSFILAKRFDPGGRISDKDVTNARDIMTGSADQAAAILQLENIRDLSNASFNRQARNTAEAVGLQDDPRFREIPTGRKDSGKPVGEMTDEELFNF